VAVVADPGEEPGRVLGGGRVDLQQLVDAGESRHERPEEGSDDLDRTLVQPGGIGAPDMGVYAPIGLAEAFQVVVQQVGVAAQRAPPGDDPHGVLEADLVGIAERLLELADHPDQILARSTALRRELRGRHHPSGALLQVEGLLAPKLDQGL
jgi:hypothetical protein